MGDRPETKFRAGNVSAAVFSRTIEKNGESIEMLSISLQKGYKKDGEWRNTTSLGVNDIPKAVLVLNKCYEYAYSGRDRKQEQGAGSEEAPDTGGVYDNTTPF